MASKIYIIFHFATEVLIANSIFGHIYFSFAVRVCCLFYIIFSRPSDPLLKYQMIHMQIRNVV